MPPASRGIALLIWARRVHLWIGLWGAALGLLFGVTGIILNHRWVLEPPIIEKNRAAHGPHSGTGRKAGFAAANAHLAIRQSPLSSAQTRIKVEPAHTVVWGQRELRQPERWTINHILAQRFPRLSRFII